MSEEPRTGSERRPALAGLGAAAHGERFALLDAVGGRDVLLDSGLPAVVFVTVYSLAGRELQPALVAALVVGAILAVLRLVRREPLQNVVAGFIGLGIAAFIASRTGKAENFFLPGLLVNAAYAIGYAVSIMARWPLLGVLVALVRGEDMSWRRDPALLRAFSLASWIWVAMFVLRLVVQVPLYLAGDDGVVALGIARVAMGWPLFFLCLWLSYVIIARAVRESAPVHAAEEPVGGGEAARETADDDA